jgi:murein L,D-transpeptidase YcbB/YkuD
VRAILILLLSLAGAAASAAAPSDGVAGLLRERLTDSGGALSAHGERLTTARTLAAVYGARDHAPLWLDAGDWAARVEALRWAVRGAAARGLRPVDYHRDALAALPEAVPTDPAAAAEAELLLSDTFLLLASHLQRGRTDPVSVAPVWTLPPQDDETPARLVDAVTTGRIESTLAALDPDHPDYARLVAALARLRDRRAAGGYTIVETGPTLRDGDVSPRVPALRRRLQEAGIDPGAGGLVSDVVDADLVRAVRRAQQREGLVGDGLIGARTVAALNVPVRARIDRVLASLERFRWLPIGDHERRIIVDIAGFRLRLEAGDRTVLEMPVVVGRDQQQTPMFTAPMTHVVLNPSWEVPPSIALDKVPALERDPVALAEAGFEVLTGWQPDAERVPLERIDWTALPAEHFPYRLRQRPGPMNALGQVKFMFPNRWDVYLHDSPDRRLFDHGRRDYSAGCVRLSRPMDLLHRLFEGTRWTPARLDDAIASGDERTVLLPAPVPVYLQYWTAAMDGDGRLVYSEDVYDRDPALLAALGTERPSGR